MNAYIATTVPTRLVEANDVRFAYRRCGKQSGLPIVFGLLLSLLTAAHASAGITVTINTDAAKADLIALKNPSLTYEEALKIARMAGNQGIIQKEIEFKIPVTEEIFANALLAAAQGRQVTDPREMSLYFDKVKPKVDQLLALTREIDANPREFQESIEKRIALFTPPGSKIRLLGYVVAGGDGGGYAFGDTKFYLNLMFNDDMIVAKTVTAHELYHAVQAAFASEPGRVVQLPGPNLGHAQQACGDIAGLFKDIYDEGSAMEVEDSSTLALSHSESAVRQLSDINEGLTHLHDSATLLELSVIGLSAVEAVPPEDVYAVGFHGHGVLYDISYGMARAIVENDGPQGLAMFLKQAPYTFALRYTQLPKYGADKDHPKLGPNTVAALNQLASGCK
jgi:hypothetical protein